MHTFPLLCLPIPSFLSLSILNETNFPTQFYIISVDKDKLKHYCNCERLRLYWKRKIIKKERKKCWGCLLTNESSIQYFQSSMKLSYVYMYVSSKNFSILNWRGWCYLFKSCGFLSPKYVTYIDIELNPIDLFFWYLRLFFLAFFLCRTINLCYKICLYPMIHFFLIVRNF